MTATTAIGYEKNLPATDPEALTAREVEVPELGPHDLLVEVEAVSVNPVDVKLREGAPANGFKVLGFDAAARIETTRAEHEARQQALAERERQLREPTERDPRRNDPRHDGPARGL